MYSLFPAKEKIVSEVNSNGKLFKAENSIKRFASLNPSAQSGGGGFLVNTGAT
jgi:hypothetical protein